MRTLLIVTLCWLCLQTANTQTSLVGIEDHGATLPDSLVFYGDSITLKIYPKADSIVFYDPRGNITQLMSVNLVISAQSPTTRNLYKCYVFGSTDTGTIIEYSYNEKTHLWGICITFENSQMVDGMPLYRPFAPLRTIPKPAPKPKPYYRKSYAAKNK